MQAYVTACKLMDLHASSWICMHSGSFWNILQAFWNILHTFCNILEHSDCILEHSACILEQWRLYTVRNTNYPRRDTQTLEGRIYQAVG